MTKPVVVIGAGPAGLACAARLSAAGRPVWVIDDNPQAGGQYFRQLPPGYAMASGARLQRETERARLLLEAVRSPSVRYLPGTIAWAAPSSLTVAYAGPGGSGRVEAAALVLATGAQDRPMPFPGWTLPGVISAGGCLNLAKGHGLVPSGRVVVAGNGPLLLVAAATLALAGCTLTHVVEARPTARLAAGLRDGLLLSPKLLLKGVRYRAALLRRGVRFLSGRMVARAMGDESLVAVEVAPVDADGQPNRSAATTLKAETLVVGYGLQPGSEFARMLGCTMRPAPDLGGWVPARSASFETSLPNIYAVGDGAGIGGVEVALLEGRLAAEAILGREPDPDVARRYARLDRFRHALSRAYQPAAPLKAAEPETIICRCEELRLAELERHAGPDRDLARVKASTRLGMGRCQGRNCLSSAATLLGLDEAELATPPRTRPPIRPVRIGDVLIDKDTGPAREPDEIAPSFEGVHAT